MSENPYAVLGLEPGATDDEIKKKYRTLVKQYHPDLHPDDPEAARKMSEINDAYERIKSGDTGQSPYGSAAYSSSAPSGTYTRNGTNYYYRYADINDFDDIFKAFFGGFGFNMHTSDTMSAEEAFERIDNYLRSGDYRNAAAVLNRFSVSARDARWYFYAAECSEGMENFSDAVQYAEQAARMDSTNRVYADYAAQLNKKHGFKLKIHRFIPRLLSGIAMVMAIMFIVRMFGFLFFPFLTF